MSGDVQPRKRKDKRRKKDFSSPVQHPEISAPKMVKSNDEVLEDIGSVNPDEVIHVQKDALLGGNICAKVVFFCLLGAIVVMVGLIIVEYRGSKSVETQTEVDSPWSQMLEGWIDSTSPVHHDDHAEGDTEEASGEEHSGEEDLLDHGHDEDEGGGDDEHENDENDDDGEEDDDASKEDHKTLEGSDENDNASGEEEEEEEEDEEDEDGGEDDEEDDEQNKSEETLEDHNLYQDDEVDESDEVDDDAETGHSDEDLNDGNDEDDEGKGDDFQGDHELPGIIESGEDDDDDDDNDENQDVDQSFHLKDDVSEEAEDGEDKTFDDITQDEGEERYAEKISENTEEQEIDENEPTADDAVEEEETSGGEESVAAAPPSEPVASSEPEIVPETLTRRQTLVAPPAVEELPPVKPPSADPEYEEEAEEEEEEEEEEESEKIKQTLEELKETYSHLTPEGSDLEEEEEYDYTPKFTKNVTYAPTPPESDQEQSEPEGEEDEEEEEEEEEEDPMRQWQSRQAAHLLAEEVEDVQTGTEEEESDDEPPPPPPVRRKGPQEADEPNQQDPEPKAKEPYINAEITNQYDWDFYEDLDVADRELNEGHAERALTMYSSLLARAPYSPRAHHGKAKALDNLAEKQRSNELLVKAIMAYNDALNLTDIPDKLFIQIANRTIDRMRFKGMHLDAVKVHNKLIARFHNDPHYRSQLAVTYLMINRLRDAKMVLEMSLQRWPKDGLTNCLYGLLLKLQGLYASSVPHLMLGIGSNENGTQESNFFFHLGDALVRIGQPEEAMKVYEDGTAKGLFRSKYQRSLYNVDRLTARPWWSIEQTTYQDFFQKLEKNWKIIRDEGIAALKAKKGFLNESESLRNTGDWKQFEIFARGRKSIKNCQQTPVTCQLVELFSPASGCRRGQTKFSVMEGGTHVWAHCGPTNTRLRAHLGLVIPPKTFIRVADEIRSWREGKVIIFDDSFEHEVWHNGTEQRLVLIVDVWHPELTQAERQSLSAI